MIKFNIFTGNFDLIGDGVTTSSGLNLPLVTVDPGGAIDGDAWVLVQESPAGGDLVYFHGAMPVTTPTIDQYLFSVKTPSGAKRVELT